MVDPPVSETGMCRFEAYFSSYALWERQTFFSWNKARYVYGNCSCSDCKAVNAQYEHDRIIKSRTRGPNG